MTFEEWAKNYFAKFPASQDTRMEYTAAKAAWEAAQPKWLPVSEAPEFRDVLVREITGHVYIAERQGSRWYQSIESEDIRVYPINWMPIPHPPRERIK
jgi:hypothetical protein